MTPPASKRIRVLQLITGLGVGGAEMMLLKVLRASSGAPFDFMVVSVLAPGPIAQQIEELGIPVLSLELSGPAGSISAVKKLRAILEQFKPAVMQCWMYHAMIIGALAAGREPSPPYIWSVRNSLSAKLKPLTNVLMRLCARYSNRPAGIVFNSKLSLEQHVAAGYRRDRSIVIPNGFELERFHPDPLAGRAARHKLGIADDAFVFGRVARFHSDKDYPTLVSACALVSAKIPSATFLLCGDGVDASNSALLNAIAESGIENRVILAGRVNTSDVMCACDVAVSSSVTEGFPNVLGEAMACEIPCVTTDAGDSAEIVGETGFVCPARDPKALADAMLRMALLPAEERARLGKEARRRVASEYEIEEIVSRYQQLYLEAARQ